jgi:hypothetical protein
MTTRTRNKERTIHLVNAINVATDGQVERIDNLHGNVYLSDAGTALVTGTDDAPIVSIRPDTMRKPKVLLLTPRSLTVPWHNIATLED